MSGADDVAVGGRPLRESADVTVVWLDEGEARDDAARALAAWARARGVHLSPITEPAQRPFAVDPTMADRVEEELDRARDALAAADADATERALARAEGYLRAHPELPQAAWLLAEVQRTWASRWLRLEPRDEARAQAAWQNAEALAGARVAGVGEPSFAPRAPVSARIRLEGASPRARVRVDGLLARAVTTPTTSATDGGVYLVERPPGEHQLTVVVDGEPTFAAWVSIPENAASEPAVAVRLPESSSCGASAFAGATQHEGRVQVHGSTCPSWIAAVPTARPGAVLVARCERDACGPLLEWRVEHAPPGPPQRLAPSTTWPRWATWTLAGIGAVTATTVALVATGAFETRPVETRFVAGGVRLQ